VATKLSPHKKPPRLPSSPLERPGGAPFPRYSEQAQPSAEADVTKHAQINQMEQASIPRIPK